MDREPMIEVNDRDLARIASRRTSAGPCHIVYDNFGKRRVIGPAGMPLGHLVSDSDFAILDQLKTSEADALAGVRGIALGTITGFVLLFALLYGSFHVGRWFERQYGADIHQSRFSVR